MTRLVLFALVLAACDTGGGGGGTPDAAGADATASKVQTVTCPNTADANVMTIDTVDAYMPMMTTVPVNGIVKFTISDAHDVTPNSLTTTDPNLRVASGETKCLKFTQAGTYGFFCTPHGFTGTITVQ